MIRREQTPHSTETEIRHQVDSLWERMSSLHHNLREKIPSYAAWMKKKSRYFDSYRTISPAWLSIRSKLDNKNYFRHPNKDDIIASPPVEQEAIKLLTEMVERFESFRPELPEDAAQRFELVEKIFNALRNKNVNPLEESLTLQDQIRDFEVSINDPLDSLYNDPKHYRLYHFITGSSAGEFDSCLFFDFPGKLSIYDFMTQLARQHNIDCQNL